MKVQLERMLPQEIERRSMELIQEELDRRGLAIPPALAPVVKRGQKALQMGAAVVTDTQMARSGINKKALARFGGEALCFMSDPDVAQQAVQAGTTRAVASMEKAAKVLASRPAIFAIGNAPTALARLYELATEGVLRPALVIGVPVGFVNVVEAKELFLQLDVPYIIARGRKGGSNVAAAIVNALLYSIK